MGRVSAGASIARGSVVWVPWKRGRWPALIQHVYAKKVTYVFFPLPKGKSVSFSCHPKSVCALSVDDVLERPDKELHEAFDAASDYLVEKGLKINCKAPPLKKVTSSMAESPVTESADSEMPSEGTSEEAMPFWDRVQSEFPLVVHAILNKQRNKYEVPPRHKMHFSIQTGRLLTDSETDQLVSHLVDMTRSRHPDWKVLQLTHFAVTVLLPACLIHSLQSSRGISQSDAAAMLAPAPEYSSEFDTLVQIACEARETLIR